MPDAPTAVDPDADTGETRVIAGRYELRRVLGSGGMGVVYEAENTWTQRRVAVKVLPADRAVDPKQIERFMQEARTASALRHPNIVDVLDMGQDGVDGSLYIVLELLEGEDLRALLAREGTLSPPRALAILEPVLRGLAAAHGAGVVHRDIKPANVFLTRTLDGAPLPKLIDFGVARRLAPDTERARTETGVTVGTPAYMAPEQLRAARDIGPTADVWAVGVMLHEMLTGETPFPSDNYNVLVHRVLSGERLSLAATHPELPATLRAVLERCLEHDPPKRYPDADALLAALQGRDVATTLPPTPAPTPSASASRVARVAAVLLAAGSVTVGVLSQRTPTPTTAPTRGRTPPHAVVVVAAPSPALPDASLPSDIAAPSLRAAPDATPTVVIEALHAAHGRTHRSRRDGPDASSPRDADTPRPGQLLRPGGAYPGP